MVGLICLLKSCGIGCGSVIMSVVWVVMCWGVDASVWTCPLCDFWVVYCVRCVALVCGFGIVIIAICMANTCGFVSLVQVGKLRG